jgi:uncharacterized repeat protein (TIGR03803 family)
MVALVRSWDFRGTCGRFVQLAIIPVLMSLIAGCGGGGGNGGGGTGGTQPPPPTITSVSVSCTPSSIIITQTATCASTVAGTGNFNSSVTWSVSPANIGSVSSAGIFTPTAAGAATITATSSQDATKSGNGSITAANTTALAISIIDLPSGIPGAVTLTDPNGQKTQATASEIIAAVPGSYTFTAASVSTGSSTYIAKLATQTVTVVSGSPTPVSIDYYNVIPQTTKVLDSSGMQGLQISSDDTTLTINGASTVAQSLRIGDVLVVPSTAPGGVTPLGMLRKVSAVNVGASTIVVTVQAATLADAFQRLSIQLNNEPNATSVQAVRALPGVIFHPGARLQPHHLVHSLSNSNAVQDPCGNFTLGVFDTTQPIGLDPVSGVTLDGQVELCAGIDLSLDIVGSGFLNLQPKLNSLTASATVGEYSDLTLQGQYQLGLFNYGPITLATLDLDAIPVPGLPVWVTPEVSVFVGANGTISTGFSTAASEAGSFTGGVSYSSGQWTPIQPTPSLQFSYTPPVLDASLQIKAYAGADLGLSIYDVVGPDFKPDGYLAFDADITANPWWALTGGVEGPMSLDVGFLGYNLASYDLGNMFDYSTVIVHAAGPFLPSSSSPAIQSLSPSMVVAGSAAFSLGVSGSNFVPGAVVDFGATPLNTTWQNSGELSASVPSALVAKASTIPVTVTNPGTGAGTSSAVNFTVIAPAITVTVTPASAQIPVNGAQQFAATVENTSNAAITWSVNGATSGNTTVGTINAEGLYTAPATVPSPATVTVTATSQADSTKSGFATVTIGPYTTKTLYSFTSLSDGAAPSAALIQGKDGDYYGTAQLGGTFSVGAVFKVDPAGNVTTLHEFSGTDGEYPVDALIQASDGNFYGTAPSGGNFSSGTIFKMDSLGNLTSVYSFSGGDGAEPAGMIQVQDGYLYGTTFSGGSANFGTVFRSDLAGNLTTLYSFSGGADGGGPEGLIQATNGLLYGETQNGGILCAVEPDYGCGTLFSIDTTGKLTTLYAFTGQQDGAQPEEALLQASDGDFYGTTLFGGDSSCTASGNTGCGTIFKIDSSGDFRLLHDFTGGVEGGVPFSSLIQAGNGDFYGTATAGGDPSCSVTASGENFPTYIGCGTVFQMDSAGNVNALYSFKGSPSDGSNPFAAVVEGNDGYLYGTTRWGGTATSCSYTNNGGCGTFFRVAGPGGPLPQPSVLKPSSVFRPAQEPFSPAPSRTTASPAPSDTPRNSQQEAVPLKGLRRPE